MVIDVLRSITLIEEHILAILREEREVTVRKSNLIVVTEQKDMPVKAVMKDTEFVLKKTLYETGKETEKNKK